MKDITVLITYSQEHQNSYINFMLSTLNHTISNKNRYKILLGVDTGVKKNPDIKKINFPFDKLIQVNTKNSDYSSFAHSLVMDEMIKHIDTKYAVICDSDIAFLQKNWDIDFINMLDEKNIFIGGESNQVTYYFPHIYMAFFNAEIIKKLGISFAPIKNKPDFVRKYNIKVNSENKTEKTISNNTSTTQTQNAAIKKAQEPQLSTVESLSKINILINQETEKLKVINPELQIEKIMLTDVKELLASPN